MKDYLAFAKSGVIPERVVMSSHDIGSPFEEAVVKALEGLGVTVVPQVGVAGYFIDIGVLRPGTQDEFVLGIECDGATYHSAKSVRDRDRLREEVIRSRGWALHRIWSTDWYHNQQTEVERLRQAVSRALNAEPCGY